jgi:hypothetical protein
MDVGKAASLYIHGSERAVAGNEMYLTAVLHRPYSIEGVRRAYRRFVEQNPAVASKLVEDAARQQFAWQPFSDEEREVRLSVEERELAFVSDRAAVFNAYYSTNERLPFRIVRVTFALSNLGRIDDPVLARFVRELSVHTRTQTIFVGVTALNGRVSIEVSFARDLYPTEEVLAVLDRLPLRVVDAAPVHAEESLAAA